MLILQLGKHSYLITLLLGSRQKNRCCTVRLTVSVDPPSSPRYGQLFMIFFVVFLTPDNEHVCSEMDFTKEKDNFLDDHLQDAGPSI